MTPRYSPWAELATLSHIALGRRRLPSGYGWWCPDEQVILLDERLTPLQARVTLAHELGHVFAGDSACGRGMEWFDTRQERRADEWAARRLVTVEQLTDLALVGMTTPQAAAELWVDVATLELRRELLTVDEWDLIDGRLRAQEWGAA